MHLRNYDICLLFTRLNRKCVMPADSNPTLLTQQNFYRETRKKIGDHHRGKRKSRKRSKIWRLNFRWLSAQWSAAPEKEVRGRPGVCQSSPTRSNEMTCRRASENKAHCPLAFIRRNAFTPSKRRHRRRLGFPSGPLECTFFRRRAKIPWSRNPAVEGGAGKRTHRAVDGSIIDCPAHTGMTCERESERPLCRIN